MDVARRRLHELEERYREISTEEGRHGHAQINASREELAQLNGATLFTMSRRLSEWNERGVLTAGRECAYVPNIQALREFADHE